MSSTPLAPAVIKRLSREIRQLTAEPPEGIKLIVNEEDVADIQAWIQGPDGTPYENGCFRAKIVLGTDFPSGPPKCFFNTKIFHPNVSKTGEVCVNTLKKDWKKEHGIGHILLTVKCLLICPNPESALNEEAGKLLLEHYDDYARHARLWTSIHAQAGRSEMPAAKVDAPSEPSKERRPTRRITKDLPKDLANKEMASETQPPFIVLGNILSSTNSNVTNAAPGSVAGSSADEKKALKKLAPGSEAPRKVEGAKRKAKEAGGGVGKEVSERKRALKRL